MNKNYAYAYTSPSLIGTFNEDVKQGHVCQRFSDNEDNQIANSKLAEKGTVRITGSSLIRQYFYSLVLVNAWEIKN